MRPATALGIIVVVAGCYRDDGVTYPGGTPVTVTVSVSRTDSMTSRGDTQVLAAVARAANGSVIRAPSVSWRTSAPSVATVSASGESATVTAVDDGTAIITATSGNAEGTITVTVSRKLVAIVLSGPDSLMAGDSAQLTVVGRDARQHDMVGLTDVRFFTTNPLRVLVFPDGIATALFSAFIPASSTITASVVQDGTTFTATKRIDVTSPAPSVFDLAAVMLPEAVRPEPVTALGEGVIFLTRAGDRVQFKMLWSWLTAVPISAHLHGPDGSDAVADVLVDLPLGNPTRSYGVTTGSFSGGDIRPQGGSPAISLDSLITLVGGGRVYVDMHTPRFVDGELRGSVFRFR
jgi:hypothetical protein